MKISFSTLGCPEWSFSEIVSTAKDLGYDGIEIRGVKKVIDVPRIPQFAPGEVQNTKKLLDSKGLSIVCLTSACCMNVPDGTQDTLYQATAYIDTAKDMGVKYIRVLADFSPQPSLPVDEAHTEEMLKKVAAYGEKCGVGVLVETNGYYADSEKIKKLAEAAGDNVGVLWDIHHPYRYFGETPQKTVKTLGSLIKHVHVKDSVMENGKVCYKMMGYGDIPIEECVKTLLDAGYDGSFCLEWVKRWDISLEESGLAFAQYASFMRSL
jgi:sugar phosphate isomerase/epimerase